MQANSIAGSDVLIRSAFVGANPRPISQRHLETRRRMTPPAILERQVAAKRTFAVVAGRARHAASRREMLSRSGRTNLSSLRRAGSQAMAIGAV